MRRSLLLPAIVFMAIVCLAGNASAEDWRIHISQAPSGSITATLSGQIPACETIAPSAYVVQQGSTFVVHSQVSSTCTQPGLPLFPFISVADLGLLSDGAYNVSWTLAVLDIPVGVAITTTFSVKAAGLVPVPAIPALSKTSLALLALLMIVALWCQASPNPAVNRTRRYGARRSLTPARRAGYLVR